MQGVIMRRDLFYLWVHLCFSEMQMKGNLFMKLNPKTKNFWRLSHAVWHLILLGVQV